MPIIPGVVEARIKDLMIKVRMGNLERINF